MGKPLVQAKKELATMIDRANHILRLAIRSLESENVLVDSQNMMKIVKEPVGPTLIISPWNYPLLTVIAPLVSAIVSGNPILLRHSIRTPKMGKYFSDAFESIGAQNWVQDTFLQSEDIKYLYNNVSLKLKKDKCFMFYRFC